ncbi:MAG: hypothetical protein AB7O97_14325 [Planctomycetota bacterium]
MHKRSMGPRPRSRDELASWYGTVLEKHAVSGLSLKAYAERTGLSACTPYDWRRRLARDNGVDRLAVRKPRLIEVAVIDGAEKSATGFVVRVNDGRQSIEVPAGFDSDELRRVVAALE